MILLAYLKQIGNNKKSKSPFITLALGNDRNIEDHLCYANQYYFLIKNYNLIDKSLPTYETKFYEAGNYPV